MMRLMEAALATGGTLLNGDPEFTGVSTDSRGVAAGELFVALRGERFDGHEFVDAAGQRGVAAAMVEFAWAEQYRGSLPLLAVMDTRIALGALAGDWRRRFAMPLIGVTGSNGKTTVKEMCAAILHAQAGIDRLDPALTMLATHMASILGQVGFAGAAAYVSTKHGVVGLTQTAALEYSKMGIRINAVGPAFIQTPMIEGVTADPGTAQNLAAAHPIGRLGLPGEVAELVIWLSSVKASFVTGNYYPADGGYLAQ